MEIIDQKFQFFPPSTCCNMRLVTNHETIYKGLTTVGLEIRKYIFILCFPLSLLYGHLFAHFSRELHIHKYTYRDDISSGFLSY